MKNAYRTLLGLGILALAPACASPDRSHVASRDPFADPSKFENLASGPFSMPMKDAAPTRDLLSEVSSVVANKPVVLPPAMGGGTLVSAALPFVPEATNRAPASVVQPEDSQSPELAFTNLVRGNERFVNGTIKGEHRDEARRRSLASAQKPFAIVLSCSDSRVPPELIFDQGLGDLFTIRVAGNVLGSAQVASIEYAVEHLGAKMILVMGHESCGAVKAAIEAPAHKKLGEGSSPDMDWLVGAIRPVLKARGLASVSPEDPKLRKPVMANIDSVTENLVVRSKVISDAIAKGNLKVARGIYSLETGRVDFWGMK